MNRFLIIAHAPLGHALRQCALHVFPDCADDVVALDVQPNMPPEDTLAAARTALAQLGASPQVTGVLVMTDMFGATPCNIAQRLVDGLNSRLVCGVNLPMLLRAISYRHESLDATASRAVAGATQGVMQVAVTAPQNQQRRTHDPDHHHHQQ